MVTRSKEEMSALLSSVEATLAKPRPTERSSFTNTPLTSRRTAMEERELLNGMLLATNKRLERIMEGQRAFSQDGGHVALDAASQLVLDIVARGMGEALGALMLGLNERIYNAEDRLAQIEASIEQREMGNG